MLKLTLQASATNFQAFLARKRHPVFQKLASEVYARDKYTCQYCGFQSQRHMEVINRDNNYENNKRANFVTSCIFCAQCHFLNGLATGYYGGGVLIFLPELSQSKLCGLSHVLLQAMEADGEYKETAQNIYQALRNRATLVETKLGEGMSQPDHFGKVLIDYQRNHKKTPAKLLDKLRLLPLRSCFKQEIDDWLAEESSIAQQLNNAAV
ncbi:MAG: icmJ [Gammaproteobacteria bacterium]|nr:icmJ [Gammaproteobacteria bacterium]